MARFAKTSKRRVLMRQQVVRATSDGFLHQPCRDRIDTRLNAGLRESDFSTFSDRAACEVDGIALTIGWARNVSDHPW